MKIRLLNSKNEIEKLKKEDEIVHLSFRPSNTDLMEIVKLCPNVKAIQIPYSYKDTLSETATKFLELQGVALLTGSLKSAYVEKYMEISD
ncbi:DUF1699 family protein [Methanohalophilus sp.]|uniref:DUF1699 family protein n=1 Tax=Methanohalophilus sp. TaxID=1966352 RepID=UPI0026274A9C|nr:DUF1699 family protein [Methanohalophilus sp.]MDK2892193.1 hypothetical protein [Methanohalophilus sp.]